MYNPYPEELRKHMDARFFLEKQIWFAQRLCQSDSVHLLNPNRKSIFRADYYYYFFRYVRFKIGQADLNG